MADSTATTSARRHLPPPSRAPVVAAAVLVALAIALRLIPGPQITDDAYITFKYVRNLASGLGFTYNPGERVLGTTTPLYTLTLTGLFLLLGRIGVSIIAISYVLNALLDGASTLLLARLGERLTGSRTIGLLCAAVWALSDVSSAVSLSGMETPLYVFLILATLLLFLAGRTTAAGLACALAVLARPDAVLLAFVLLAYLALRERRRFFLPLVAGLLTVAPWLIFSLLYFGSPIATSVVAKNVVYFIPAWEAVRQFAHHWSTLIGLNLYDPPAYLVALSLTALWLWGMAVSLRRGGRAVALAAFPALYVAAFGLANKPMFRWYFVPLEPFYLLGLGAALRRLIQLPKRHFSRTTARAAAIAALALVLCLQLLARNILPDAERAWLIPKRVDLERERLYARAADDIDQAYPTGRQITIATPEIGAFGYHSRARILDTTGLVSPEAIRYYPLDPSLSPECNYAVAPNMIRDLRPELVVALEIFVRHSLLADPWFESNYVPAVKPYETDVFGSRGLLVFRRRDWPQRESGDG